jgi:hypothetical protein
MSPAHRPQQSAGVDAGVFQQGEHHEIGRRPRRGEGDAVTSGILSDLMPLAARAYQKASAAPVISAETTCSGAPLL